MHLHKTDDLPPSPLDPTMRVLDVAEFVSIGAALFCGWQLGEWWGLGLAASLVAADFLEAYRTNLYRNEIYEGIVNLVNKIHGGELDIDVD